MNYKPAVYPSRSVVATFLGLCFVISAFGQAPLSSGPTSIRATRVGDFTFAANPPVELRNEKLASVQMGREMPYRIILPSGYSGAANSSKRYPVIYLLHGLLGHYNNWTDLTKLDEQYAGDGQIIVMPEGENGWYTDSSANAKDKYESYIIKELLPEIDKRFRTMPARESRAIAGLSMGGYGSIKFGLKYPELFSLAGSFSGALGAASITEKDFPGAIGKSIESIFGPTGSASRNSNDIFLIIRSATPEKIKTFPYLYLDCGTEDFLFKNNRDFVTLLLEKDVPHEYRQLPGAHNWAYWDAQVQEFLRVAARRFAAEPAK